MEFPPPPHSSLTTAARFPLQVRGDGACSILYEDGDSEETVAPRFVKASNGAPVQSAFPFSCAVLQPQVWATGAELDAGRFAAAAQQAEAHAGSLARAEPRHVPPERSSGRNVATMGRDASSHVVAAAAAAAAAAAVAAAATKATARAVRVGTTPALQPAAAAAPPPAPPPAAAPPPPPRSLVLDANPESAAEVADAATAASDCPACAGRHRPHTCDRRKGRKERKRDALSPVRPERCAPASMP